MTERCYRGISYLVDGLYFEDDLYGQPDCRTIEFRGTFGENANVVDIIARTLVFETRYLPN